MKIVGLSPSLLYFRNGGRLKMDQEGRCRMCLTPRRKAGVRMLTRHHIVPREFFTRSFGDPLPYRATRVRDCNSNIVPLCVRCHNEVETDIGARWMLRKVLGQNEIAFAIQMRGAEWFDRRYPRQLAVREAAQHGLREEPSRPARHTFLDRRRWVRAGRAEPRARVAYRDS